MYGSWVNAIPSRFVDELPENHIESEVEMGMAQAGRSVHWDSSGMQAHSVSTRTSAAEKRTLDGAFTTGDRVFHDKFGYGKIIHIDGSKLDIHFEQAGAKRLMDSFVKKCD
jgi:DNA helicase-2/ATP-dependent DNA helicase PcrA